MSNFDNILHAIFTCLDEPAKFNKQLLITTTEEAEGMELCGLFVPLHVANQLRTVFIEEAHVFSTHGDYRLSVWCLVDYALPALILVNSDCTSMAMDCMISSLICLAQQEHLCSLIACYCMASVFKILHLKYRSLAITSKHKIKEASDQNGGPVSLRANCGFAVMHSTNLLQPTIAS